MRHHSTTDKLLCGKVPSSNLTVIEYIDIKVTRPLSVTYIMFQEVRIWCNISLVYAWYGLAQESVPAECMRSRNTAGLWLASPVSRKQAPYKPDDRQSASQPALEWLALSIGLFSDQTDSGLTVLIWWSVVGHHAA